MLNQETIDQLARIEEKLDRLLGNPAPVGSAGISVLQEASINDLARDFGKRGAAAFASHNERRKKQLRQ